MRSTESIKNLIESTNTRQRSTNRVEKQLTARGKQIHTGDPLTTFTKEPTPVRSDDNLERLDKQQVLESIELQPKKFSPKLWQSGAACIAIAASVSGYLALDSATVVPERTINNLIPDFATMAENGRVLANELLLSSKDKASAEWENLLSKADQLASDATSITATEPVQPETTITANNPETPPSSQPTPSLIASQPTRESNKFNTNLNATELQPNRSISSGIIQRSSEGYQAFEPIKPETLTPDTNTPETLITDNSIESIATPATDIVAATEQTEIENVVSAAAITEDTLLSKSISNSEDLPKATIDDQMSIDAASTTDKKDRFIPVSSEKNSVTSALGITPNKIKLLDKPVKTIKTGETAAVKAVEKNNAALSPTMTAETPKTATQSNEPVTIPAFKPQAAQTLKEKLTTPIEKNIETDKASENTTASKRPQPFQNYFTTSLSPNIPIIKFALGMKAYKPVGDPLDVTPNKDGVSKLVLYTMLKNLVGTTVTHTWYLDDVEIAKVPIKAKTPYYRSYSSKNILPSMTGHWRVDVKDESGNQLAVAHFDYLAQ